MIELTSRVHVSGMRAALVIDFMANPTDAEYQAWWPGTHFQMHAINAIAGVGQRIVMNEMVGERHLRMTWEVTALGPDHITWQLLRLIRLPCWLSLRIEDDADGATVTHTISAGWRGWAGVLFDPLIRRILSERFACAMQTHVEYEFTRLPSVLCHSRSRAARHARLQAEG